MPDFMAGHLTPYQEGKYHFSATIDTGNDSGYGASHREGLG